MREYQVERARDAKAGSSRSVGAHQASVLCRANISQPSGNPLLQLQRDYGNRYVRRLLALARKGEGEAEIDPAVESAIARARSGGRAMDGPARLQMERAFGADFSGVRVHTGTEAHSLSQALNAVAFTTGQDIFFQESAYNPGTSAGKELLAHELTHVVQQGGRTVQGKLVLGPAGDSYEQEADSVAREVVAGLNSSATSSLQRQCACGGQAESGGKCAECRQKGEADTEHGEILDDLAQRLQQQDGLSVQTKLSSQGRIQRSCSACEKELQESELLANPAKADAISRILTLGVQRQMVCDEDGTCTEDDAGLGLGATASASSEASSDTDTATDGTPASDGGDTSADAVVTPVSAAASQFQTDCSSLSYRDCTTGVYKCGYGGSGTCGWTGIAGKCKCLGASQPTEPVKQLLPSWLLLLLSAAAIALIAACFASGVCEAGAIIAAAGAATAAIVIGILRAAGVDVRGEGA